MKNLKYTFLLLLPGLLFGSCHKEKLNPDSVITVNTSDTEFDKWIRDNYTNPYNISIKYTWQDIEANTGHYLDPADIEKCKPLAKVIQYIWLETFNEVMGVDFLREHSPKVILMVGSWAYNTNNTYTLGSAESGMKITLYGVNELDFANISGSMTSIERYMKTIIHEFCHILHQKKMFDPEFERISSADYVEDNWSADVNSEANAYALGFISRYGRKNQFEDFVELLSHFIVYGQEYMDDISTKAGADGAAKLKQKFDIATSYLTNSWRLDIYELRRVFDRRLNSVENIDLK
ncbi:MAG: putative zinc-binding metallopeptidase [Alistipes sp.]|jgi:substrate import-associated zinc metallohydrolase lipoprotein|nr:putative zinc-binding metallopeptidase [Alistipes sp.]